MEIFVKLLLFTLVSFLNDIYLKFIVSY
jgi:hypothetical protein